MNEKASGCRQLEQTHNETTAKLDSCRAELSRLETFAPQKIEQEMQAKSILDAAVDGIVIISEKGIIQSFNPAAEKIFGYRQAEVVGKKVNMLMPEPHRSRHDNYIQAYLDTGRKKVIGIGRETMAHRKDGTTFPVELAISEVVLSGQRIFTGVIKDITARRKSASDLQASEERFRLLLETMSDGLAVQDADGKIIYANPRFCAILGYEQQCLMGRLVTELLDASSRIVLQGELEDDNSDGIVELKMKKDDGEPLYVRVSAKAIRSTDGQPNGSFVVITDVTHVKRLQRQLLQSQKMEAIGRLAGGIAHDFNNLLTVILGFADLALSEVKESDSIYRHITQIDEAAKRAESLTRQLLAFSRKQVMLPEVLSLNQTVSGLERLLQRLIGEDILLKTSLDPALGVIKADEGQIEQVIINIAVNARDAMPTGGQLLLETANIQLDGSQVGIEDDIPQGRYVRLSITDTGTGMDRETQSRIFEPFFTTKDKGHGTGLGLSTVFGIVKQSGGEIRLYTEPDKGTCFSIYLPRIDAATAEARPAASQSPLECGHETILVVEDERTVRELIVEALRQCGYHVLAAADAIMAMSIFAESQDPINLLLTDMVMPKMSGRDLVQRLRQTSSSFKVLYMSGYTDDALVGRGALTPDTPFIHKPFTPQALTAKIREVLDT